MIKASRFYTIIAAILIAGTALFSGIGVFRFQQIYRKVFPDVSVVKRMYPVAVGREGNRNLYTFQQKRPPHWKTLQQFPKHVVAAVLLSEDHQFFQHKGYSPEGIRIALEHNLRPGNKVKRGGSTITQQVVKNLFLSPEKTMARKARELLLAVELERKVSKGRILETYLNIAEWGPGIYGMEQASQKYFSKPSALLSAREAAILAFMLPNPRKYQHSLREDGLSAFAAKQVGVILERMWRTGHISDEEYTSAGPSDTLPSNL